MFNGLDCRKCTAQLKSVRGCNGLKTPQGISGLPGIEVDKCPARYASEMERLYLDAYREYEKGFLPNAGGWLEQPIKFGQVMQTLENLILKFQKESKE